MTTLTGEAWYRRRNALPRLREEPWLPLDVVAGYDDRTTDTADAAIDAATVSEITQAIDRLERGPSGYRGHMPSRYVDLLRLRYGLDGDGRDMRSLAEVRNAYDGYHYTVERIRQIVNEAIDRVRAELGVEA